MNRVSKLLEENDVSLQSFEAWLQNELTIEYPTDNQFTESVLKKISDLESSQDFQDDYWTNFSIGISVYVISFLLSQSLDQQADLIPTAEYSKNLMLTSLLLLSSWHLLIKFDSN